MGWFWSIFYNETFSTSYSHLVEWIRTHGSDIRTIWKNHIFGAGPPSKKVTFDKNTKVAEPYFDKSSAQISNLMYKTWFSRYPRCWYTIHDNGSEFKLHFQSLCDTYGIKRKPTSVKYPQANAILEHIHAVLGNMLRTSDLDMAKMVKAVT